MKGIAEEAASELATAEALKAKSESAGPVDAGTPPGSAVDAGGARDRGNARPIRGLPRGGWRSGGQRRSQAGQAAGRSRNARRVRPGWRAARGPRSDRTRRTRDCPDEADVANADPLLRRPPWCGKDVTRTQHRQSTRPQVRAHVTWRYPRRGGDSGAQAHVHRGTAWTDHSVDAHGGDAQRGHHAR